MKAVVLLSGGLDSSTTLYQAKATGREVIALSFPYNQRHYIEIEAAKKIAERAGISEHILFPMDFSVIGGSALTGSYEVPKGGADLSCEDVIPVTYVPARNLIFLSIAAAVAESRGAQEIYIGVNSMDYSGYPDCRPDFISSFEETVNLATRDGRSGKKFTLVTPLISFSKKEIILKANSLGVPLELTWSCYDPVHSGDKYIPCGECDSCLLRSRGFAEAGLEDPAMV